MERYYELQYRASGDVPWRQYQGHPQKIYDRNKAGEWLCDKRATEADLQWQAVLVKKEPVEL